MLELFTTRGCPFCEELRSKLDWDGQEYVEHDVDADPGARARLFELAGPNPLVPVVVEDGRVTQAGWQGRGCVVGPV